MKSGKVSIVVRFYANGNTQENFPIYLFIYLSLLHLFVLFIYLFVYLLICLFAYVFIYSLEDAIENSGYRDLENNMTAEQ
jgi:hypothetical protein